MSTTTPEQRPADGPEPRRTRKDDHLRLAAEQWTGAGASAARRNEFDDLEFVHDALGGVDSDEVDLTASLGEWRWSSPFFINGMTGGTKQTTEINAQLARVARETGVPMACGSMSIALEDAEAAKGFAVLREENPDGFLFANVGAGRSADDAARAVELIAADGLQLHVNAVQETVMPEGSRDFSSWLRDVEDIVAHAGVPVVVKEVGFGLTRRALSRLADVGVQIADVGGRGGTDFLAIENARRQAGDYSFLTGYGQSAPACLLEAHADGHGSAAEIFGGPGGADGPDRGFVPTLLASGGVRNPLDVAKALALGASAVGVAGTFLDVVQRGGEEALSAVILDWQTKLRELLGLIGAGDVEAMRRTDVLVRGRLREYCELRGVDAARLARRAL
ncbi:isopentenyl-diphosphate delta-isomerase [Dietzia sp.]|uniref:isopentenyl-diphosphate delta-isomerase n=1 Tax=Dietzia sp. TaxID=1871616 RepID=UPI002FD8FE92